MSATPASAAQAGSSPAQAVRGDQTLPGRLLEFASERGHKPALRHKRRGIWQEITWHQYAQHVAATGRMLWEMGVRPGDHVAILSDNRPEWLYADLAAQGIGARSVGVYQTSPAADVAYIVNHSRSRVLFCEGQEQVDKVMEIADATPHLEHVVVFDPRGTRGYSEPRLSDWASWLEEGHRLLTAEPDWFAQQVARLDPRAATMVVYTSGTTGEPKGALLSSANVCELMDALIERFGAAPDDAVLSYLPLCHVAEKIYSVFMPLAAGFVVHFGESIDTVQEDLREVSPTLFLGVPRIWEKMHASVMIKMQNSSWLKKALFRYFTGKGERIAARRRAGNAGFLDAVVWALGDVLVFRPLQERMGLRRCRMPGSGAAPIARELLEWFHGVGVPVFEGFGMTELAGASHFNPPDDYKLGTVGKVLPGLEQRVSDDGELLIRGPSVFLGYLHDEEATRAAIDADGWLHTGDVAEIDAAGFLTITGRKKDILITAGGKNLSPAKIENALKTSPFIKEVVAVGDSRNFVSVLVQIDYDTVGNWAQTKRLPYTSYGDLAAKSEVVMLIEEEIQRCNALLARVEQARKFRLLPRELTQDDGELTATQKVRRRVVIERYTPLIDAIYGSSARG